MLKVDDPGRSLIASSEGVFYRSSTIFINPLMMFNLSQHTGALGGLKNLDLQVFRQNQKYQQLYQDN